MEVAARMALSRIVGLLVEVMDAVVLVTAVWLFAVVVRMFCWWGG